MSSLKKELLRKLIHLFQIPIIVGYTLVNHYFSQQIAILTLTGLLLLLLEWEYFRFDYQTKIGTQVYAFFSKFILRRHEQNNITGAIFFVISAIIAFAAFDYTIAVLSLMFVVLGDLAASLMGIAFGKKKIFRKKSYIGSLSGLVINCAVGLVILTDYPEVFLPMALVATVVETMTQKLDDNLTVPLFAGFAGQLIIFWYGILLPGFFW